MWLLFQKYFKYLCTSEILRLADPPPHPPYSRIVQRVGYSREPQLGDCKRKVPPRSQSKRQNLNFFLLNTKITLFSRKKTLRSFKKTLKWWFCENPSLELSDLVRNCDIFNSDDILTKRSANPLPPPSPCFLCAIEHHGRYYMRFHILRPLTRVITFTKLLNLLKHDLDLYLFKIIYLFKNILYTRCPLTLIVKYNHISEFWSVYSTL